MRKIFLASIILLLALAAFFYFQNRKTYQPVSSMNNQNDIGQPKKPMDNPAASVSPKEINIPLAHSEQRVTKKPFGIFITPQNSPVSPERFRGYHTGIDFEIFPEELSQNVQVKAICDGKILGTRWVSGYGGVLWQNCQIGNQPVVALYGHLDLASVQVKTGDQIKTDQAMVLLGADKSQDTDGERKHLHLGIIKGSNVNFTGYVQNQTQLSDWLDTGQFLGIR